MMVWSIMNGSCILRGCPCSYSKLRLFYRKVFTSNTLVQKQDNQQRQDMRRKYGFVHRLHTDDEELRHYFNTMWYEKLTMVNFQFFNAFFLLYFLGSRPGYAERKGHKVETYTGLLILKQSSVSFSTTGDFKVHIYFIDKSKKDFFFQIICSWPLKI